MLYLTIIQTQKIDVYSIQSSFKEIIWSKCTDDLLKHYLNKTEISLPTYDRKIPRIILEYRKETHKRLKEYTDKNKSNSHKNIIIFLLIELFWLIVKNWIIYCVIKVLLYSFLEFFYQTKSTLASSEEYPCLNEFREFFDLDIFSKDHYDIDESNNSFILRNWW